MSRTSRIETLTRNQSLDLLALAPVGRIVFTDHALPAILPVTFVVDGDCVVIRTARGSRLARAADDAVVAFEVDEFNPRTRTGWSVVVTGEAVIDEDPERRRRLDTLLEPWVPGIKDVFIRIPLGVISGRRVVTVPVSAPPVPAHR